MKVMRIMTTTTTTEKVKIKKHNDPTTSKITLNKLNGENFKERIDEPFTNLKSKPNEMDNNEKIYGGNKTITVEAKPMDKSFKTKNNAPNSNSDSVLPLSIPDSKFEKVESTTKKMNLKDQKESFRENKRPRKAKINSKKKKSNEKIFNNMLIKEITRANKEGKPNNTNMKILTLKEYAPKNKKHTLRTKTRGGSSVMNKKSKEKHIEAELVEIKMDGKNILYRKTAVPIKDDDLIDKNNAQNVLIRA